MTEAAQAGEHDIFANDTQAEPEVEAQPEVQAEAVVGDGQAESAPAEKKGLEREAFDSEGNPIDLTELAQSRINKVTADKYGEKRRADALQERLEALEAQQPVVTQTTSVEPTLESCDHDEEKFYTALMDYKLDKRMAQLQAQQGQSTEQARVTAINKSFDAQVAAIVETKPDYQEVIANVPTLPNETLQTVMSMDNGADIAYYLGKHLDVADEIASASPIMAAMRLGEIRAQLANGKPKPKHSAAPDPIDPISAGGKIASERGPKGATFE
jgi:hypothetical protein